MGRTSLLVDSRRRPSRHLPLRRSRRNADIRVDAQRRLDAVLTGSGQVRCRLRNQFNQVLYESDYDGRQLALPDLAPGSYFCDFWCDKANRPSASDTMIAVASPVGKVDLAVPEVHEPRLLSTAA